MRRVGKDLEHSVLRTMSVGMGVAEAIDLNLDSDEGIIITDINFNFSSTSAAPTITGAGLSLFQMLLFGKEQAVPVDITQYGRIMSLMSISSGTTGVGSVYLGNNYYHYLKEIVAQEIFINDFTANITNAATTIVIVNFSYDRYVLTQSEKVALL